MQIPWQIQCEHKLCLGAHCDPWVSVQVNRDRRSLRRRPPSPITQFRTKVIQISDWLITLILLIG